MITQTKLSQLENSITPGSLIVTDSLNENIHFPPGTNGQVLQIVGGVPTYQTLSFGGGGITSFNGLTSVNQLLNITNTTAARAWTSIGSTHTLNIRAWDLNGNAGTNQALNFVGTTDVQDLAFRTNNQERMRIFQGGGVGIGVPSANVPATNLQGAILNLSTPSFTRVLTTISGASGIAEYYAGNGSSERTGFGYSKTGSIPFAGITTSYGYIISNTPLNIGNTSGNPQMHINTTTGLTGINTINPVATLSVFGSLSLRTNTITVTSSLTNVASTYFVNNGATAITITLPAAASNLGLLIKICRMDNTSTGTITINTSGGLIQALVGTMGATTSLSANNATGSGVRVTFQSNGANWYRVD